MINEGEGTGQGFSDHSRCNNSRRRGKGHVLGVGVNDHERRGREDGAVCIVYLLATDATEGKGAACPRGGSKRSGRSSEGEKMGQGISDRSRFNNTAGGRGRGHALASFKRRYEGLRNATMRDRSHTTDYIANLRCPHARR